MATEEPTLPQPGDSPSHRTRSRTTQFPAPSVLPTPPGASEPVKKRGNPKKSTITNQTDAEVWNLTNEAIIGVSCGCKSARPPFLILYLQGRIRRLGTHPNTTTISYRFVGGSLLRYRRNPWILFLPVTPTRTTLSIVLAWARRKEQRTSRTLGSPVKASNARAVSCLEAHQ